MGWSSMNDDGYFWIYRTEQGIIATCTYTYMKIMGVEKWKGKMAKMPTDFMLDQVIQDDDLDNLSGCVEWVNFYLIGGYYL